MIFKYENRILKYARASALFGPVLAVFFVPMIDGIIADCVSKRNIIVTLDFSTAILILLFYLLSRTIGVVPCIPNNDNFVWHTRNLLADGQSKRACFG